MEETTSKDESVVEVDGKTYDHDGHLVEWFEGRWQRVLNGDRQGWWRFNEHYDRHGYCDNPGRGY